MRKIALDKKYAAYSATLDDDNTLIIRKASKILKTEKMSSSKSMQRANTQKLLAQLLIDSYNVKSAKETELAEATKSKFGGKKWITMD